ncbi:hypothetical protein [Streptomyces sp. NPDC051738]|uniref:hypothetical protein n=1 Tax=Streptomyces sp. NPDC051738 TaxID=3365672 RepID=UPI0037CF9B8C
MSTGVIILVVVAVVVVLCGAAVLVLRARGAQGSRGLKRRFGPEYERAVARHHGDAAAAERELAQLVERHGGLRERALEPDEAERFEARWAAAQEHFVDAPRQAVGEADQLLAELARARGPRRSRCWMQPDGERYEEQLSALSVHHADHVQGYRHVHRVAHGSEGRPDTEEMREALIEGRALFEDLVRTSNRQHATRS